MNELIRYTKKLFFLITTQKEDKTFKVFHNIELCEVAVSILNRSRCLKNHRIEFTANKLFIKVQEETRKKEMLTAKEAYILIQAEAMKEGKVQEGNYLYFYYSDTTRKIKKIDRYKKGKAKGEMKLLHILKMWDLQTVTYSASEFEGVGPFIIINYPFLKLENNE